MFWLHFWDVHVASFNTSDNACLIDMSCGHHRINHNKSKQGINPFKLHDLCKTEINNSWEFPHYLRTNSIKERIIAFYK